MANADTQNAPVRICGIIPSPDSRMSLDELLRGLAGLQNLCIVLVGDAEGLGPAIRGEVARDFGPVAKL